MLSRNSFYKLHGFKDKVQVLENKISSGDAELKSSLLSWGV